MIADYKGVQKEVENHVREFGFVLLKEDAFSSTYENDICLNTRFDNSSKKLSQPMKSGGHSGDREFEDYQKIISSTSLTP